MELGFERKARLFCDKDTFPVTTPSLYLICWDLSVRLGYFVTPFCLRSIRMGFQKKFFSWDLSVRLGYFVTFYWFNYSFNLFYFCWDLSVRLGYFVTALRIFSSFTALKLGFERKARLFCDFNQQEFQLPSEFLRWDLSVRLGYFVTCAVVSHLLSESVRWDLSVRLGYFVTWKQKFFHNSSP